MKYLFLGFCQQGNHLLHLLHLRLHLHLEQIDECQNAKKSLLESKPLQPQLHLFLLKLHYRQSAFNAIIIIIIVIITIITLLSARSAFICHHNNHYHGQTHYDKDRTSFCLFTSFATERSFFRWNSSSSFTLSSSTFGVTV